MQVAPSLPGLLKQPAASRDGHEDSSSSACPGRPAALHGRRGGAPGKARRASEWRCGRTSKCSRQAGSVPRSARAQRPVRTLRNVSLCGRRHDRLQLICIPLGLNTGLMEYLLAGWTRSDRRTLSIGPAEYELIHTAKARLVDALRIEEKFNLLLENYRDVEQ